MALLPVAHKPTPGRARQFDGTLDSMLDILGARPLTNASVTLTFTEAGDFTGLQLSNADGVSIQLTAGDWVVFPDNPAELPISLTAAHAGDYWTAT